MKNPENGRTCLYPAERMADIERARDSPNAPAPGCNFNDNVRIGMAAKDTGSTVRDDRQRVDAEIAKVDARCPVPELNRDGQLSLKVTTFLNTGAQKLVEFEVTWAAGVRQLIA